MNVLENNPIWKEASKIAKYVYEVLGEIPEDERWQTGHKLHMSANYLLHTVSAAIGSLGPSGTEYEWGNAHKHAVSLRAMLDFAYKQKFLPVNADLMVSLDKLIKQLNTEFERATKQSQDAQKEETARWEKHYDLWKKANDEIAKATK